MPELTEDMNHELLGANIPFIVHATTLDTVAAGPRLKQYIVGEAYTQDRKNGRGMCLHGEATNRVRVFPVLARAMVLARDSVLYLHVANLWEIVCSDNHPLWERATTCSALFVSNFCTPNEAMPFTPMERMQIEEFLLSRCQVRRRNYYSAREPIGDLTWWTEDFRNNQSASMSNYSTDAA